MRPLPERCAHEATVVGTVLVAPRTLPAARSTGLKAEHFYDPGIGSVFAAMCGLADASRPITAITVAEQMQTDGSYVKLKARGGEKFFSDLLDAANIPDAVAYYAKQVRGVALVRRIIEGCQEIADAGYAQQMDVAGFLEEAPAKLLGLMANTVSQNYATAASVVQSVTADIDSRIVQKAAVRGVPTGLRPFDRLLRGKSLQSGDLVIVAARPAMGKTSAAMQFVQHAAVNHDHPCLVFSRETKKEALIEQMIANRARLTGSVLDMPQMMSSDEGRRYVEACSAIAQAPIFIDDQTGTIAGIQSRARAWRMEHPVGNRLVEGVTERVGLVVVDYLQLVEGRRARNGEQNREREVAEISRALKLLAMELRCPVVALSQVGRKVEERKEKRPQLSDLRESGAIEQDADVVVFLYRDEVYDENTADKGIAEFIISKQRKGPTKTCRLAWLADYTAFEEIVDQSDEPPPPSYHDR